MHYYSLLPRYQGNNQSPALSCVPRRFIWIPELRAYTQGNNVTALQARPTVGSFASGKTHAPTFALKCPKEAERPL